MDQERRHRIAAASRGRPWTVAERVAFILRAVLVETGLPLAPLDERYVRTLCRGRRFGVKHEHMTLQDILAATYRRIGHKLPPGPKHSRDFVPETPEVRKRRLRVAKLVRAALELPYTQRMPQKIHDHIATACKAWRGWEGQERQYPGEPRPLTADERMAASTVAWAVKRLDARLKPAMVPS